MRIRAKLRNNNPDKNTNEIRLNKIQILKKMKIHSQITCKLLNRDQLAKEIF